jgi:hypothetical protein
VDNFASRQSPASHLPQQLRQLGDVGGNTPGLVLGQQARRCTSPRFILELDIRQRLPFRSFAMKQASLFSSMVHGGGKRRAAGI